MVIEPVIEKEVREEPVQKIATKPKTICVTILCFLSTPPL